MDAINLRRAPLRRQFDKSEAEILELLKAKPVEKQEVAASYRVSVMTSTC